MASPAGGLPVPERKTRHLRTTGAATTSEDPVVRLQEMADYGKVPSHVKLVIDILLQTRDEVKEMNRRNAELMQEISRLREENFELRQKLTMLEGSRNAEAPERAISTHQTATFFDSRREADLEIDRSIVLANIPESLANNPSARVAHDSHCVTSVLDFLGIECFSVVHYRMGKPQQGRPRLMKVVLPASKFQREAVRRAPRLRFFPLQKGVYLRPSLTWEERQRRREQRLASREPVNGNSTTVSQTAGASQSPVPTQYGPSINAVSSQFGNPSGNS